LGSDTMLMYIEPMDGPHAVEFTSRLGTKDLSIAGRAVGRRNFKNCESDQWLVAGRPRRRASTLSLSPILTPYFDLYPVEIIRLK
jgi:hypothetical protein